MQMFLFLVQYNCMWYLHNILRLQMSVTLFIYTQDGIHYNEVASALYFVTCRKSNEHMSKLSSKVVPLHVHGTHTYTQFIV